MSARWWAAGVAALSALTACGVGADEAPEAARIDVGEAATLAELVTVALENSPGVPAIAVAVRSGSGAASAAAGDDEDGAVTVERPLRISSNTKTFVAAAVLRLVEDGELALGDPLAERGDPELLALLRQDGYDPASITVEQLLTHTSGIADFASDVDYQTVVLGDPLVRWTRLEQVRWAVDHGEPLGAPGAVFAYSDTGYVLLGDVVERATGLGLGAAVRALLRFEALGLDDTFWEVEEEPPAGRARRAHQFYETQDMFAADPSFDLFGGGGLVSTVGDLATFYEALLAGDVFEDSATLTTMLDIPPSNDDAGAAMGLFRYDDQELGSCWNHSGFWGTVVIACADVTIALSVFQANPDPPFDGQAFVRAAAELATAT